MNRLLNIKILVLKCAIPLVAISVTPWHNLDPVSVTKLLMTSIVTSLVLVLHLLSLRDTKSKISLWNSSIIFGVIAICVSLAANNQFLSERIFGVNGRNVGAVFILCALILQWISGNVQAFNLLPGLALSILASSILVSTYFVIQKLGLDIANWVDAYGGVPSSTLGNPNFVSSFISIGASASLPLLLTKNINLKYRLLILFALILQGYVIVESNSVQGISIFIASFSLILIVGFKRKFTETIGRYLRILQGLLLFLSLLLLLFLYIYWEALTSSSSVRARLDYWSAGISMIIDAPFTGQGLDYFGESYFQFRTLSAAERAPGLFTDSAHNYIIDFGTFAGVFLVLSFLIPLLLTFLLVFRYIFRSTVFPTENIYQDWATLSCIVSWLGYLTQSLVSPISHALLVLGVILTGFIFSQLKREKSESTVVIDFRLDGKKIKTSHKRSIPPFKLFSTLATKVIGIFLALFIIIQGIKPFDADANFRDAIEQGNGEAIYSIALADPLSYHRMELASMVFLQNNLPEMSIEIIRAMVKENPDNIRGWRLMNESPVSTSLERTKARAKMLELDPFNLELRKQLEESP